MKHRALPIGIRMEFQFRLLISIIRMEKLENQQKRNFQIINDLERKIVMISKNRNYHITKWLQEWAMSQVDGDWEHEQGVRIYMLDNPGWNLSVDMSNYADYLIESKPFGRNSDENWIDFEVKFITENSVYIEIFGDITKLNQILFSFKSIIEELELIEEKKEGILLPNRIKELINSEQTNS